MIKKSLVVMSAFLTSFLGVNGALAAADADVLTAAETVVSTTKENVFGVITGNVSTMIITGVLILSILIVWRLGKRFVSGR